MELTLNEFRDIVILIQDEIAEEYWKGISYQAWLGQYIAKMLGSESTVYEDIMKKPPTTSRDLSSKPKETEQQELARWKESADKKGLRYE